MLVHADQKLKIEKKEEALAGFKTALASARESDQIQLASKSLRYLGQKVELPKVFGWITEWKVIGPFDNENGAGFEKRFGPETNLNLTSEYDGKNGKGQWKTIQSKGDLGVVDLNSPLGNKKSYTG